ncbi:MAG: hypothetical protein NZ772_06445 [Cyanobacteria bacterium]|nr:hypothetical protein [Cyanobacteriota bacterium]MDW8201136.1 hypothetical protein [Cyanobacteriota bacterium SKYGB_h_bin112]
MPLVNRLMAIATTLKYCSLLQRISAIFTYCWKLLPQKAIARTLPPWFQALQRYLQGIIEFLGATNGVSALGNHFTPAWQGDRWLCCQQSQHP